MKRFYFYLLKTDHFWGFNALLNKYKLNTKFSENLGQELDYYHQKVNVGVASPVAERLKTSRS